MHPAPTEGEQKHLGNILVLDQEPNIRKLLKLNLVQEGFDAIEAGTSEDAVAILARSGTAIHVILCDVQAPKIHGIEAVSYFRTQYPRIPIVILAGYPDVYLAVLLMRKGVVDYLVKPVAKDDLMNAVRYAIDQYIVRKDSRRS